MIRTRTYICPVSITELEAEQTPENVNLALSLLTLTGVRRLSFVARGGPASVFEPRPDEVARIAATSGRFGKPAETRYGCDVQA